VIVIGAYAIRHEAERKGWVPGLFDLEHLDHRDYLRNWGDVLLNAEAAVWRFADIPQSSLPERFFCRPAQDNKLWKAGPTTRSSFWRWQAQIRKLWDEPEAHSFIQPDTGTVIAPLREIAQEHRLWIVDGRVATSSLYKAETGSSTKTSAIPKCSRSRKRSLLIRGSRNESTCWMSAWGRTGSRT
jgi:hypothetical protein